MGPQNLGQWSSWGAFAAILLALGAAACAEAPRSDRDDDDDDETSSSGVFTGGSSSASGAGSGGAGGTGGTGTGGSGTGGSGTGGINGGGTGFTSPMDMFDYVNQTRDQYKVHTPYDGYPFEGVNADAMTWALILAWDEGLAGEAQIEAEKIAAGAPPEGKEYPFANEPGETFWAAGLETDRYKITGLSDANTPPGKDAFGNPKPPNKWQDTSNGFYRLAVAYQTGTGEFNQKTKLGVGAADDGATKTWWVLLFSE
jgi:hypothetical protein